MTDYKPLSNRNHIADQMATKEEIKRLNYRMLHRWDEPKSGLMIIGDFLIGVMAVGFLTIITVLIIKAI